MEKERITREHVDGLIFSISQSKDFGDWYDKFSVDTLRQFMEDITSPDYGKKGNYSFFCKKCGGSWFFETKEESRFFGAFHKFSGCVMEVTLFSNKSKAGELSNRRVDGNISSQALLKLQEVINERTKLKQEEINDDKVETTLPGEQSD